MRRRILLLVVGMTALVVLAFAVPLALLVRSAVEQRAANAALARADDIARFLTNGTPTSAQISTYLGSLPSEDAASVVLSDGTVLGKLPPGPAPRLPSDGQAGDLPPAPQGAAGPGQPGESGESAQLRSVPGGRTAYALVHPHGAPALVQVFVSDGALHAGVGRWWALLAGGSAALLVLGVVGGEVVTRRIVRPLVSTADTAHRLSAGDVAARAPESGPAEVAAVGTALNRLADRIDELIAEERETVADLSHRMRTPLTALRLDAEALADPADAERIGGGVSELERTLTAVIRAARRPQREGRLPGTDATAVVADRVVFWSALTDDQRRPRTVTLPEVPVPVRASAEDLAAAVDALLQNVIAHTPEGTPFAVRLSPREDGGAVLEVDDAGPGLPAGAGVRGRSDRGSGLGLDIARRCAEASGGRLETGTSALGGASVRLVLGRA